MYFLPRRNRFSAPIVGFQINPIYDRPVYDITLSLSTESPPQIHKHDVCLEYLEGLEGDLLQLSKELDVTRLRLIVVKSAKALRHAHFEGKVHGSLWPGAFLLTKDSITLRGVGLYKLLQNHEDRIVIGPAHGYKARGELTLDPAEHTEAMDIHSWGKTIISLYSRSLIKASLRGIVSPSIPQRPQEMPEDIWNVVVQCLPEGLDIQVTMDDIVRQLIGI